VWPLPLRDESEGVAAHHPQACPPEPPEAGCESNRRSRRGEGRHFARHARHADTPEQRLLHKALDDELRAANELLPLSLRQTLWLRDIEGLSYADIAKRLGIPTGTVMSRLSRARRMLYARLAESSRRDVSG